MRTRRIPIALGFLGLVALLTGGFALDALRGAPPTDGERRAAGHGPAAMADGPCDELLKRALEEIQDTEKTGNVLGAQKAVALLLQAERACPESLELPFWRAIAEVFARNLKGAEEALARLRRLVAERAAHQNRPSSEADTHSYVLFVEATMHQYIGSRPDLALERLTQLKARDPRFMPDRVSLVKYFAHVSWGSHLARRGDFGEAVKQTRLGVEEAKRQMARAPGNTGAVQRRDMANRNLGEIYRLSDRWVEAQQVYEELAQLYPKDGVIHYGLASVYAEQSMFVRAAETWTKAVALIDQGSVTDARDLATVLDAKLRLGISLVHAQRADEGRKILVAYAEAHPDDARVFQYLGRFAMDVWEEFDKAQEWLERAHALDPWCRDTIDFLVKLYTLFKPDEPKRAAAERLLKDEALEKKREAEMKRRKATREDASNGCR